MAWRAALIGSGVLGAIALAFGYMTSTPGAALVGAAPLTAEEAGIASDLAEHVDALAKQIGPRRSRLADSVKKTTDYLYGELRRAGLTVVEQKLHVDGEYVQNLEVVIPGGNLAREAIVVGAHYDSETSSPGADDNASGCAVLLEIAKSIGGSSFPRTIHLVFFANGEPPYLKTERMGSRAWIGNLTAGEEVVAMLSIDSVGCYREDAGSQSYPFPLGLFYPSSGDFVGVAGDLGSRNLVRRTVDLFRSAGRMPAEGLSAPGWIPGVLDSDHWSFRQAGIPAVVITDTHTWRNAKNGTPDDVAGSLDTERMARAVSGILRVIQGLAHGGRP